MRPDLVFDASHLITRLTESATTGIDRVDLAYARHYLGDQDNRCISTQYGLFKPHILGPARGRKLLTFFDEIQREHETSDTSQWVGLRKRLAGATPTTNQCYKRLESPARTHWYRDLARQWWLRIVSDWTTPIPKGAIYLSVAQHAFEHMRFFRWLDGRPDVRPVFFIHDLLPLDFPEFFPPGYQARFLRRVRTMRRASALITSSHSVAERVRCEFSARHAIMPGNKDIPILVEPLPSPLQGAPLLPSIPHGGPPYFVVIGTIEPRKNHNILLEIWRRLTDRSDFNAKLVLVGQEGWQTKQTMREIMLTPELQGRVLHVSGLSPAHLKQLLQGAVALLMPSSAEGYGLPIVEALSLQIPVVCSDIPVFREISQGKARYRKIIDGLGWRDDIVDLARPDSGLRAHCIARAKEFVAPTWTNYFHTVDAFLSELPRLNKVQAW